MLFVPYVAAVGAAITFLVLVLNPPVGLLLAFTVRPLVDTAWNQEFGFGLRLTEIFSVVVPFSILIYMAFLARGAKRLAFMPLKTMWLVWVADVVIFSALIMISQGPMDGLNVLFRHMNGFIGFYAVQAFYREDKRLSKFLLVLLIAGLFPIGIGVFQLVTDYQWNATYAEGLERNIGMYHDAITVRYYAMQTIWATLVFAALYLKRDMLKRALTAVYGLLSVAVMFKAYSKAGMATFAMWFLAWTSLQKKIFALAIATVVGSLVAVYYANEIVDQIGLIFHKEIAALEGTGHVERTFAGRWYLWEMLWNEWMKLSVFEKIFGAGKVALGAHSDYLQILFHGGIVGLCIYVALLLSVGWKILRNLMKKCDPMMVGALMAFIMWMVDTVGLVPSAYSGYQWFVWGVIGLGLRRRQDEEKLARSGAMASH